MRIVWSTRALERVLEAAEFADMSSNALDRFVTQVFEAVARLETFPRSGRIVPEIGDEDIREVLHRRLRVIYRLHPDRVEVLTVRPMRGQFDPDDVA